jgi:hypothetical protein
MSEINLSVGKYRIFAAENAAMLAVSASQPESKLTPEQAREYRDLALQWLNEDLQEWETILAESPDLKSQARNAFSVWSNSKKLSSLREKESLQKLSAEEREQWEEVWVEVRQSLLSALNSE